MASCMLNCAICLLPFFCLLLFFLQMSRLQSMFTVRMNERMNQPRDIIGIAVFVYENECQQAG